MKRSEFLKIKKVNDDKGFYSAKLKVGEKFLIGESMTSQAERKQVGEDIAYYVVDEIRKDNGSILYIPVIEKLEK